MPNNEFAVTISGDAKPLKDATDEAKEHLKEAGDSVDMLGDLIGVKVPEGISKMLAATELIGPALEAAFIPLSVITLGVAIFDLTEKLKQQREELEKTKTETLNEALAVNQYANALQTNTLKLQDQLAVLQKKPATNGIKIAMEEGRKATADLVDEFTKAIDKLDELLQKQKQGLWDRLMNGDNGSNAVIDKANEFKTEIDDLREQIRTADSLGNAKEAADYKTLLDKKQEEFRKYVADQQKALADQKANAISTLTKSEESVASGPNGETQVRDALSLADANKQVNAQFRDRQRILNDLTIETQSYATASAQVAKNNTLNNQIAAAEARKSKDAFDQAQKDKVATVNTTTRAIVAIDEKTNQQTLTSDFSAIKAENDAVIKAANEQLQAWDEGYKGQIETAKIASETRIQLITQEFEHGKITQQQEIAAIAKAKQDELQQEIVFHQKRQALWAGDLKKVQEIENQITKAQQQSILIGTKAVTDGLKAQEQQYKQVFSQIGSAFTSTIMGMVEGTETVTQAFTKMFESLIKSLANYLVQKAAKKAEEWAIDKLFKQTQANTSISAAAGMAFADAFADSASLGPQGLAAAPAVASGAATTVSTGAHAIAALAIGTNYVPMDGLAYLHKGEKVIPAGTTGPGYSGNNGGGNTIIVHHTVQAVDAASFQQHIRRHSNMIANEVTRALKRKA
jgi:hypothetical protein